jgi:hypothetical protein
MQQGSCTACTHGRAFACALHYHSVSFCSVFLPSSCTIHQAALRGVQCSMFFFWAALLLGSCPAGSGQHYLVGSVHLGGTLVGDVQLHGTVPPWRPAMQCCLPQACQHELVLVDQRLKHRRFDLVTSPAVSHRTYHMWQILYAQQSCIHLCTQPCVRLHITAMHPMILRAPFSTAFTLLLQIRFQSLVCCLGCSFFMRQLNLYPTLGQVVPRLPSI